MSYTELTPIELLTAGVMAPRITDEPWLVRWDRVGAEAADLVLEMFPAAIELRTSGSSGAARTWSRTREQLWTEAGMLAGLLRAERPESVLSFAPPRHLYGTLVSVLVPARLGLPVWYQPQFFGAMPPADSARWAVMAVPWTFTILRRQAEWVGAAERLSILHSTATLPTVAADFLTEAGEGRANVTEVFGSTETGGVASRRWTRGNPAWELFDDVEFAAPPSGGEVPLVIRSPRLAAPPDGRPPDTWKMDDYFELLDDRHFRFAGRRDRLLKINGRRVDLDALEESFSATLDCADLALLPVTDTVSGENFDLLVVPHPGPRPTEFDVRAAISGVDARPRRIQVVNHIDRSETGKVRRIQQPLTSDAGADA